MRPGIEPRSPENKEMKGLFLDFLSWTKARVTSDVIG